MESKCPNCSGPATQTSTAEEPIKTIFCGQCDQHFKQLGDGTWSLAESPDKAPTEESLGTGRSEDGTEPDLPDSDDEHNTSSTGDHEAAGDRQQPAASEPALKCSFCGCTDDKPCWVEGVPCHWVEPDLCSACLTIEIDLSDEEDF